MDVNVRDYGAVGDDATDDTLAFRNALNAIRATGGTCFVPPGVYKIAPTGITGSNNIAALTEGMHLMGMDGPTPPSPDIPEVLPTELQPPAAFLSLHDPPTQDMVRGRDNNWSIEKMGFIWRNFYGSQSAIPVRALALGGGKGWKIDKCWFLAVGRAAISCTGAYFTISDCYVFNQTTIALGDGHTPEGVVTTTSQNNTFPHHGKFIHNVIDGCAGFSTLGNNHLFKHNTVTNMSFASGFFEAGTELNASQNRDNIYIGNTANFGKEGPDNYTHQAWTQARGFEIWTPYTLMFRNTATDNCGTGFALGCKSSVIAFNRAIDNGKDIGNPSHVHDDGFSSTGLSRSGAQFVNNSNTMYLGNTAIDTRPAGTKTQRYGIHVHTDRVRCLSVVGNNFHGNEIDEGIYLNNQPNVTVDKGRDMFRNTLDEKQRNMIRALLDADQYDLTDGQYVTLNQLLTGSTNPR